MHALPGRGKLGVGVKGFDPFFYFWVNNYTTFGLIVEVNAKISSVREAELESLKFILVRIQKRQCSIKIHPVVSVIQAIGSRPLPRFGRIGYFIQMSLAMSIGAFFGPPQ